MWLKHPSRQLIRVILPLLALLVPNYADAQTRFAYVADDNRLTRLSLDQLSGAATLGPGTLMPAPNAREVIVESTGRFLYVVHQASNGGVSSYTIDSVTGALTSTGLVQAGIAPQAIVTEPFGRFAYVASHRSNSITVFAIDGETGTLTPIQSVTSRYAEKLRIDPTGRFLYVLSLDDLLSVYDINVSFGIVTLVSANIPAPVNSLDIAVDPTGRFLYAGGSNQIASFTINVSTGALTAGPVLAASNIGALLIHPTGRFVFSASGIGNSVRSYFINPASGALTALANQTDGISAPTALAMDPVGRVIYVLGSRFATLVFDPGSGGLGLRQSWNTPGAALAVVHPNERSVHAGGAGRLSSFRASPSDGTLSNRRATDLLEARLFALDPANRFAFAVDDYTSPTPGAISTYRVNPATNTLTRTSSLVVPEITGTIDALTVDPTGRFVLAACRFCENPEPDIFSFRINPSTGAVALAGSVDAFTAEATVFIGPTRMVVHRNGRYVYATLGITGNEARVSVVRINPATGALDTIGEVSAAAREISGMAMDPLGRYLYLLQVEQTQFANAEDQIAKLRVNLNTGGLSELQTFSACGGQCFGGDLFSLDLHPTGRYLWVLRLNQVKSFSLNHVDGTLDYLSEYNVGGSIFANTDALDTALEATGRFLYVSTEFWGDPSPGSIRDIRILSLNPLTGAVDGERFGATIGEYSGRLHVSGPIR